MSDKILLGKTPGYQRMVRRKRGYGTWQPFIDAEPVRQHIAKLQASGLGRRRIAELAGLHPATVTAILYGRGGTEPNKRIRPATAHKILSVQPGAGRYLTPSTGTIRRVQALMATGWPQGYLAGRLGVTNRRISDLLSRDRVTATTAESIAALYNELRDQDPAIHGVKQQTLTLVRNYAAQQGWKDPDYWDDMGRIDDPDFDPDATEKPLTRAQQVAEDAAWLLDGGLTRDEAAERLGVSRFYIDRALRENRQEQAA